MFHAQIKILLINCLVVFSLTGCAIKQMELTESGFLSGYSGLEDYEELEGMRIYKNPDVNIVERYSKILVAPVEFKLDPTVKEHKMDFEDELKLSNYFHETLIEGLIINYDIADEPGEDVLLLRIAITDILPNKVYLNLHWATTLIGGGIGGASLEAELIDSLTGERMFSFIDARKGKKLNYTKGLTKWGHTQEVLGMWAKHIVKNLDDLKTEQLIKELEESWANEE